MKLLLLNQRFFFVIPFLALLCFSSCQKDTIINGYLPPLDLPDSVSGSFGDTLVFELAEEFRGGKANFKILAKHPGQQVDAIHSLQSLVQEAVLVDAQAGKIFVYTHKLYPNGAYSEQFQNTIPNNYPIEIKTTDNSGIGMKGVSKLMNVYVKTAKISIVGQPNKPDVLMPYCIYSDLEKSFILEVGKTSIEGASYQLTEGFGNKDNFIEVSNDRLVVKSGAGDGGKKKEFVYSIKPALVKNGYKLAQREIKLSILPDPELYYGIYYEDLGFKIIYNQFHIALGNAFTSDPAVVNPVQFKGQFRIRSITLNDSPFQDNATLFAIDPSTGVITLKKNDILLPGQYTLQIENDSMDGRKLVTTFSIGMQYAGD